MKVWVFERFTGETMIVAAQKLSEAKGFASVANIGVWKSITELPVQYSGSPGVMYQSNRE